MIEISKLKQTIQESDRPIPQLYDDKLMQLKNSGYDLVTDLPTFNSVKHSLYDARNKGAGVSKTVFTNVMEVVIPIKYNKFILADYYYNETRIILFCNEDSRELITKTSEFFMDGTFKSCPSPFTQLFTVHGDVNSSTETNGVVPMLFALMSNRKADSYVVLFSIIKSQIPEFHPVKIHCDFELATMNAVRHMFPTAKIIGCYYHWCRCVWRKAKSLGHTKYKAERRIVQLTAALPLIPEKLLTEGWTYIKNECGDEIKMAKFINYIQRFWINKPYLHNVISVFGERYRTNNVLEGWHSKLNRLLNKNTVTVMRLLNVLFQLETVSKIKYRTNANIIKRRKSRIVNDYVITRVQMQLTIGEISLGHALDKLR